MATITSAEENAFVASLIAEPQFWKSRTSGGTDWNHGPWLGGYRLSESIQPDPTWKWVTGEPFTYSNWGNSSGGRSQPSSPLSSSVRLHYYSGPAPISGFDDDWDDADEFWAGPVAFVVEWNANPVPEPSTLALLGVGCLGLLMCVRRKRR